jgi:hypothetical protein
MGNYVGVHWDKTRGKFKVQFKHKKKRYNVGYFDSEIEAVKAYDKAKERVKKNDS